MCTSCVEIQVLSSVYNFLVRKADYMKIKWLAQFALVSFVAMGVTPVAASIDSASSPPMPQSDLVKSSHLRSVSCTSENFCVAVGYQDLYYSKFNNSTVKQTLTKVWRGAGWMDVPSPNQGVQVGNQLFGVTCLSETFCKAVGTGGASPIAISWNGSVWSMDSISNSLVGGFVDVSCVSVEMCVTVGSQQVGSVYQTLVAMWSGANWTMVPSPNSAPSDSNNLLSVSCKTVSSCVAVGGSRSSSKVESALAIRWDGLQWSMSPTPSLGSNQNNFLRSVSCAGSASCVAVGGWGSNSDTSTIQSLILVWDGNSWLLSQNLSFAPENFNSLLGASCLSNGDCIAIGKGNFGQVRQERIRIFVVERIAGGGQKLLEPKFGVQADVDSYPQSVSCVSLSWCMVVGSRRMQFGMDGGLATGFVLSEAPKLLKAKFRQTIQGSRLAKFGGLSVPKGSKISLSVSAKHQKVCRVVGTSLRTVGRGSCQVKTTVLTKDKRKSSKTVTVKVG